MVKFSLSAVALTIAYGISSVLSVPSEVKSVIPPAGFKITSFGVNGSGCPPGSALYFLSEDKTTVNVTFSQYYASAGPGIAISENRKNCQLTFGITVPSGFSYGIASTEASGYYYLDQSVIASQQTYYYFQGQTSQTGAKHSLVGPVPGVYYSYTSKIDLVNFSPCGTSSVVNINTDVRVNNDKNSAGSGFIATDSTGTSFSQIFNFAWQTC